MKTNKYINIKIILFLLISLITTNAYAVFRTIKFKHLTSSIALKQSSVNCIFQDSTNFIYFGTNEGLFRYDGNLSELFWNSSNNENTLNCNNIVSGCEFELNKFIISTSDGLFKFDGNKKTFTPISINNKELSKNISFFKNQNSIWSVSTSGVYKLKITKHDDDYKFELIDYNYLFVKDNPNIQIEYFTQNSKGDILIASEDNKIYRFNTYSFKITEIETNLKNIKCLYEDKNGTIWIGTTNKTLHRHTADGKFQNPIVLKYDNLLYEFNSYITSICEDINGNIIIGSNSNGLAIIKARDKNRNTPKIEYYTTENNNTNTICDNNISSLYLEKSGAVFIGTRGNGVNIINTGQDCFSQHIFNPTNDNSLDHIRVNAICEDQNGNIWFGTRLGLNRYNRKSKTYFRYHNKISKNNYIKPKGIDMIGEVTCFCFDSNGDLWFGTYGEGVYKYMYQDKRFTRITDSKGDKAPAKKITDITTDKDGNIWVSTHGHGFAKITTTPNNNSIINTTYFHCSENTSSGHKTQNIDIIYIDKNNQLWITQRDKGLFRMDPNSLEMQKFVYSPTDTSSISNNFTISICSDKLGNLWMGTARGLNKYSHSTQSFTNYTIESGLPHNSICGVLSDNNNKIWLYTQRGIYRFDPSTLEFKNFIENSRIFHEAFTIDATFKNKEGKLFMGTLNNGCIEFHPDSISKYNYNNKIVIKEIKISGETIIPNKKIDDITILTKPICHTKSIKLKHHQNDISLDVVSQQYLPSKNRTIHYRLKGDNKKWNSTVKNQKVVQYSNLKPGNYTFETHYRNSKNITSLQISIEPPFWATSTAYFIYLFIILAIAYSLYRYTSLRIKLKNELNIERMKLSFFTNISHEFRTPLTLISGPLKKLISNHNNIDYDERNNLLGLMKRNSDKLMNLADQILDIRKIENRKMYLKAEQTDIISFIKEVTENFKHIASSKNILLNYSTELNELKIWIDKDKIEKVISNLLSNAIKHTPQNGNITVYTEIIKQHIRISVGDTGAGIATEHLKNVFNRFFRIENSQNTDITGTGIGLSIAKSFTEMHKGTIYVKNNLTTGCTFTIEIPLGEKHLTKNEKITDLSEYSFTKKQLSEDATTVASYKTNNTYNTENENNKPLLLVVDDNIDIRFFIESNLSQKYRIISAENGKQGLELALEHNPDLIISDVMMPVMNGLDLCKNIKKEIRICHIPVILLTAKSADNNKIEGIETGADSYITKPFDIDYLQARVENLLLSRIRLREAYTKPTDSPSTSTSDNTKKEIKLNVAQNPLDIKFLQKANDIVVANLANPDFSVPLFTEQIAMSNSVLYRKLKALTDLSANEFIKDVRLTKSVELLKTKEYTISEVANLVGFNDPKYFGTCFKKKYGKSPSGV